MWNLVFLITGLFFISFLIIIFISKKVLNTKENRIFRVLALLNFIGYIFEILLQLSVRQFGITNSFSQLFGRLYLLYIFIWFVTFNIYTFLISLKRENIILFEKNYKILKKFNLFFALTGSCIILLLNQKIYFDGENMYSYGPAIESIKVFLGIFMIVWSTQLIRNMKHLKEKKFIPIFLILLMLILNVIIQSIDPSILIATTVGTFICYTMYFTIENPDLKMVEELIKNKKLTETNIEDKSNILFKISQEVRMPASEIMLLSKIINEENELDNIYKHSKKINMYSKNIYDSINNIFDISNIDINNIKLISSDYNSHNLFNEIILLIKEKNKKNIDFKYNITSSLPEYLYGDSLRLKQIICSIIAYSIKTIKKGIIDLDISTIISYDICRLIITINDNGNGLSLDIINSILETNTNIDEKEIENVSSLEVDIYLVKKIIDMIGGILLIKSEDDLGTTYTIIINQKIKKVKNNKVISQNTKYSLSNKKHILIIDDNYQELENFAKAFRFNNFDVTTTMYGKDCINKLSNGEKFDYIFIDDEMNPLNAVEIIKNIDMKKENVIIMLSKNKERIKKHYINDYQFNDYFLKNIYKSEIKRMMNK